MTKPRLQTSRGFRIFLFALVGDGAHDIPKANEYKPITPLSVILSVVELLPSEERGKSASHKAKRDLAWNLGGFFTGCNIHFGKTQKFVRRSLLNAKRFSVLSSLFAQRIFDFAQNDIQKFCWLMFVCFLEEKFSHKKRVRYEYWLFCNAFCFFEQSKEAFFVTNRIEPFPAGCGFHYLSNGRSRERDAEQMRQCFSIG